MPWGQIVCGQNSSAHKTGSTAFWRNSVHGTKQRKVPGGEARLASWSWLQINLKLMTFVLGIALYHTRNSEASRLVFHAG
mmetsp:Transcript_6165/g.26064  ORF Transcript_6165/g.26064 Transcript_6165/m.26064 type:complete len:80 (-) Transcript_6165:912-1151(-)